jgi:branched-chain amino acid transport system substrate-binding protein
MDKNNNLGKKELSRRDFIKAAVVAGTVVATTGVSGRFNIARGASGKIKIGVVMPFSGVYGMVGPRGVLGLKYAFSKTKYADRVKFYTEDSRVDPSVSVEKAQKLVEKEGVDLVVGPAAAHTALAISEYCKRKQKMMLLLYGGNVKIAGVNCSRYTFMVGHTIYSVSAPAVPWCVENLGKKIFVVGADYISGHDIVRWFKEGYQKHGGTIVGEAYPKLKTTEFAPYLNQIKAAKPDVVGGFLGGTDAVNITKQFYQFGLHKEGIRMIWAIGSYSETALLQAMGDSSIGHLDIMHYSNHLFHKENVEFRSGYAKFNPKEAADDIAMLGYEVGNCIIYALDKAGGVPETERMVDGLLKRKWVGPRGECSFSPQGVIIHPLYVRTVVKVGKRLLTVPVAYLGQFGTPSDAMGPGGECKAI